MALQEQLLTVAEQTYPFECVGILAGQQKRQTYKAQLLVPLPNLAPRPQVAFAADPLLLLQTLKHWRGQGLAWVGQYHSHPKGPAQPSRADLAVRVLVPQLIVAVETGELGVFYWD